METVIIPVIITGSNGKQMTLPYAKIGWINGKTEILMNELLVAMVENYLAKQEEGYSEKEWTPDQISRYETDPVNHQPYHGVSLVSWEPATVDAKNKLRLFTGVRNK